MPRLSNVVRFFAIMLIAVATSSVSRAQYYQTGSLTWLYQFDTTKPFEHFSADDDCIDDDDNAVINATLMEFLSSKIYRNSFFAPTNAGVWGVNSVSFISTNDSGTEVGFINMDDALIVVFRGSHWGMSNTWNPVADWLGDLNATAIRRTIGDRSVYVHEGFWYATGSAYADVRSRVRTAHNQGKKIWITGHSLGGAVATLTAARLQYDDDIPVRGLHTFGSPRVGDSNFRSLCHELGPSNRSLYCVTRRWVVEGDFATTLFPLYNWIRWRWSWWVMGYVPYNTTITYHHVGQTNQIFPNYSQPTRTYTVDYGYTEDRNMVAAPTTLLAEHGLYNEALRDELEDKVNDADVRNKILELQLD
ncbi:hypothetical protein NZK35_05090 [Stieleria sp. ICT_E10.1]|uniref:lipase family protein n=1 Tax=Stieleria sedimenti TaxID=2976331 RepID=UPI00217F2495|nr:hypothetical protein [Stieleria sedimenti]MCS7466049.1 hypothetical protein [Stieleria sedimenti]